MLDMEERYQDPCSPIESKENIDSHLIEVNIKIQVGPTWRYKKGLTQFTTNWRYNPPDLTLWDPLNQFHWCYGCILWSCKKRTCVELYAEFSPTGVSICRHSNPTVKEVAPIKKSDPTEFQVHMREFHLLINIKTSIDDKAIHWLKSWPP